MNSKLLVVCGQTGTGKTSLAFYLADLWGGELVSADSRQVYRKLDVGTGKDLLKGSRYDKRGFFDVGGIKIWGYDLVDPKKVYSVGNYLTFARRAIKDILKRGKQPILVGGTGLYIKGVVDGIPTAFVPQNNILRKRLEEKKPDELYEILAQLDPIRAGSMNHSDRLNPRRLVRAIEVASYLLERHPRRNLFSKNEPRDILSIGLTTSIEKLTVRIGKRVDKRIKEGLEKEIKGLLAAKVGWHHQSMSSLGYRQWKEYFEGTRSRVEVINNWKNEEIRYAKRQLTWFKKDERIKWFDVADENYVKRVEKMVGKWYARDKNGQKS